MAKLDVDEIVGKEFENKYNEKFVINKYLFKEKTNHCYEVRFLLSNNIQVATLNQIRNGTCRDIVERKKQKRLKTERNLRERNKLIKKSKVICVIPKDLKSKNVLGIDLSSTSTGIAFSHQGKIVRWKTIKSDKDDFRDRGFEIIREIVKILETGKIDYIIIEDVFLGLNSDVLIKLSEVRGMLTYHIKRLGIDYLIVPAVLWKNRIENVPLHRKEQKEFMMQKFFEYTGIEANSDDEADAYMILKVCLEGEVK